MWVSVAVDVCFQCQCQCQFLSVTAPLAKFHESRCAKRISGNPHAKSVIGLSLSLDHLVMPELCAIVMHEHKGIVVIRILSMINQY